jgi:hydroxymethylpyrimidine pyrophosphatase-like HAD family hydrolase
MSKIVLCDIDGTVANNDHRQHLLKEFKDWDKFFLELKNDHPIFSIIDIVQRYYDDNKNICFITGRPERYRAETKEWLEQFFKFQFQLIMRKDGDARNKVEIKKELFHTNFNSQEILISIENDKLLCELWSSLGLEVIDVNKLL